MKINTLLGFVLMVVCVQPCALAVTQYSIVPLGLTDPEHTDSNGDSLSGFSYLNEAGQAVGQSARYNGGSTQLGLTVWRYAGATTSIIGLTSAEHIRNDGYKFSYPEFLNEAGQVLGYSERYNGGSTELGETAWLYDGTSTIDIGLTGAEHTRNDGYKYSDPFWLNEAGQATGYSLRYNGGSTELGETAWLYDGTSTIDIGLTGLEHTRDDGYRFSDASLPNEAGQVLGFSERYNGGNTNLGRTAWLFNGTTTIDIGFVGAEYTRNDGYKYSDALGPSATGQAFGESQRFNGGSTSLGRTAWLYNGTTTIAIGLTDTEHTRNDDFRISDVQEMNEAGQVLGYAERYNGGNTSLGKTTWLYNGTSTIVIGPTGAEHTRNDGHKRSNATDLNSAGQVLGYAERYNGGSSNLGRTAWLFNGTTTIDIGLVGAEHTRNDGYKFSTELHRNEAGQVIGHADRYNGGAVNLGQSAWLFDGTTTVVIGLTDTEHTSNNGNTFSFVERLSESGKVVGYSQRYNGGDGSTNLGRSAWLYNGTTTVAIGLTGAEHTSNNGAKFINPLRMNEAGQVSGYSWRYNGGSTPMGQDAWFYDPTLNQTFSMQLSQRSDGYADSFINFLGEDGLALGTYKLYDALDNLVGDRAFYFTVADGLHDLGALVDGGLTANGWDSLANAFRATGFGQIVGHGTLISQSNGQMVYLLTPLSGLDGDYNNDNFVDAADYTVWRNNLGTNFNLSGNGDESNASMGIVDEADYTWWKQHYGNSNLGPGGGGLASRQSTNVPEPATLTMLMLAAAGWCLRWHRTA